MILTCLATASNCLPTANYNQEIEDLIKRSIDDTPPALADIPTDDLIKSINELQEEESNESTESPLELIVENSDLTDDDSKDDLVPAGSSVVFRPLFVYRYQQIKRRRRPRSAEEPERSSADVAKDEQITRNKRDAAPIEGNLNAGEIERLESWIGKFSEIQDDGEMEVAESIVFRPLFRYRHRYAERRRRS